MRTETGSLSDGQMECLQLIGQNLTSKEIAARLGISPHTVDKRVKKALRKLGAPDRRQAARLVQQKQPHWQQTARGAQLSALSEVDSRPVPTPIETRGLPLPFATEKRATNTMRPAERMLWIVAIAVAAGVATFVYLAGLESLGRVLGH